MKGIDCPRSVACCLSEASSGDSTWGVDTLIGKSDRVADPQAVVFCFFFSPKKKKIKGVRVLCVKGTSVNLEIPFISPSFPKIN